jgi:glyoxylase-like metal-dependent hydrolase (beta-lactamase superfamily II)
MSLPKIDNLKLKEVTEDILLIHQIKTPYYFSCCDGLIVLPKKGRNLKTIILDLNIEPYLINKIDKYYGPISNYVCTHAHMDHMAHIHQWESIGAMVNAPIPEHIYLLDLYNFYEGFGFNKIMDFSVIKEFGQLNGYKSCINVKSFKPGEKLIFENLIIESIPFLGHSKAHVGFFLPNEKILHISCLGFDQRKPGEDGFGPWYGFEECSIDQYIKDIGLAESIFLEKTDLLTSSHSYIVKNPDTTPFTYMRDKIAKNQDLVDQAIRSLKSSGSSEISIKDLLELDLFFPKKKMKGFMLEIYNFWESGIISKHMERSKYLK